MSHPTTEMNVAELGSDSYFDTDICLRKWGRGRLLDGKANSVNLTKHAILLLLIT